MINVAKQQHFFTNRKFAAKYIDDLIRNYLNSTFVIITNSNALNLGYEFLRSQGLPPQQLHPCIFASSHLCLFVN